jgi:hypothetical protein
MRRRQLQDKIVAAVRKGDTGAAASLVAALDGLNGVREQVDVERSLNMTFHGRVDEERAARGLPSLETGTMEQFLHTMTREENLALRKKILWLATRLGFIKGAKVYNGGSELANAEWNYDAVHYFFQDYIPPHGRAGQHQRAMYDLSPIEEDIMGRAGPASVQRQFERMMR